MRLHPLDTQHEAALVTLMISLTAQSQAASVLTVDQSQSLQNSTLHQ